MARCRWSEKITREERSNRRGEKGISRKKSNKRRKLIEPFKLTFHFWKWKFYFLFLSSCIVFVLELVLSASFLRADRKELCCFTKIPSGFNISEPRVRHPSPRLVGTSPDPLQHLTVCFESEPSDKNPGQSGSNL